MKKVLAILMVAMLTIVGQTAMAQGNSHGKGKAKGKPSFVEEKHRAHAEWKREKEYAKAHKKANKHRHYDDDDRWERDDDDRWRKDDDRRVEGDSPWERVRRRSEEQRRAEERRDEQERPRTARDVILKRTGKN